MENRVLSFVSPLLFMIVSCLSLVFYCQSSFQSVNAGENINTYICENNDLVAYLSAQMRHIHALLFLFGLAFNAYLIHAYASVAVEVITGHNNHIRIHDGVVQQYLFLITQQIQNMITIIIANMVFTNLKVRQKTKQKSASNSTEHETTPVQITNANANANPNTNTNKVSSFSSFSTCVQSFVETEWNMDPTIIAKQHQIDSTAILRLFQNENILCVDDIRRIKRLRFYKVMKAGLHIKHGTALKFLLKLLLFCGCGGASASSAHAQIKKKVISTTQKSMRTQSQSQEMVQMQFLQKRQRMYADTSAHANAFLSGVKEFVAKEWNANLNPAEREPLNCHGLILIFKHANITNVQALKKISRLNLHEILTHNIQFLFNNNNNINMTTTTTTRKHEARGLVFWHRFREQLVRYLEETEEVPSPTYYDYGRGSKSSPPDRDDRVSACINNTNAFAHSNRSSSHRSERGRPRPREHDSSWHLFLASFTPRMTADWNALCCNKQSNNNNGDNDGDDDNHSRICDQINVDLLCQLFDDNHHLNPCRVNEFVGLMQQIGVAVNTALKFRSHLIRNRNRNENRGGDGGDGGTEDSTLLLQRVRRAHACDPSAMLCCIKYVLRSVDVQDSNSNARLVANYSRIIDFIKTDIKRSTRVTQWTFYAFENMSKRKWAKSLRSIGVKTGTAVKLHLLLTRHIHAYT